MSHTKIIKISPEVPGKKILKCFTIYRHGSHLGHVTSILLMNFNFRVLQAYIQNLAENGPVVTEKRKFNFHMQMTLGQDQEMTLTFNTHISSLTQISSGHRVQ